MEIRNGFAGKFVRFLVDTYKEYEARLVYYEARIMEVIEWSIEEHQLIMMINFSRIT